jgi:hypothetical protein
MLKSAKNEERGVVRFALGIVGVATLTMLAVIVLAILRST